MLAISIPATLYADGWGRRTAVIVGGTGLAGCMYIVGCLYITESVHTGGVGRWFVIVLIFVFALLYVSTWGIVGKIYASEIQPAETRAAANSIAQGVNFVSKVAGTQRRWCGRERGLTILNS
jgi:MFS family permease